MENSIQAMDKFKLKLQIQEFCGLLLREENYDVAFEALQELNRCKLPKILLKHLFNVVWKHCLTLYHRCSFQECLRWSNAAFHMSVCLDETTDLASIASVIADIYLQTKEWSQLERHILLFRDLRQPFMEHMFNLEMALCKGVGVSRNVSHCLERATSLDNIKKITKVLLKHGNAAVLSKYSLSLLQTVKAPGKDFNESEVATIFSIVLVICCDGDLLEALMDVLGEILAWNQKLTKCDKMNLEMELRTILDHCENWIDSKLKESASHVSNEMLKVGTQMCAVLLILYNPKEDMPHICRTLSHQTQLLCKLEGLDKAKKHLLKMVSSIQSLPEHFVRQILLDVQLDNLRFDPILRLKYFQKDGDKLPDNASALLKELNNLPKTSTDDKNDMLGSEIMLRLAVAKLLEIDNELEKNELIGLIEQLANQLFQHIDPACSTWLSTFFYEIGLISKNSTVLGFAAKLQTDFSIRSRLRAIQLNASFQNQNPRKDEISEAVKEIVSDDLSAKDYEEMNLYLILKFKGYLLLEEIDNDVKDLVSVVIRHKDWATLEVYAALLTTMGADRKLLLKCLIHSNTMALHDGQVQGNQSKMVQIVFL